MLLADTYRLLAGEESIIPGDQFKLEGVGDDRWHPVEKFVGHRVREFCRERAMFRRLIARGALV